MDDEFYNRETIAKDNQWAQNYGNWGKGASAEMGFAASGQYDPDHPNYGYDGHTHNGNVYGYVRPSLYGDSAAQGSDGAYVDDTTWDAWGRNQDLHEKINF